MLGKLTDAEIVQVLSSNVLGRIGCCQEGQPYIVPISYAYVDHVIYCRTVEGMKLNIMRSNPRVCFEVEEVNNMANWRSVIASGTFEEIVAADKRIAALDHLAKRRLPVVSSETTHFYSSWPFLPDNLNDIDGVVFKITLHETTGRFERFVYE